MAGINTGKLLLGGVVAWVVMTIGEFVLNEVVLAQAQQAAFDRMNLSAPGGAAIAVFIVLGLVTTCTMMWVYAVSRDKLGPGRRTAVCAAVAVWVVGYLVPTLNFVVLGMFDTGTGIVAAAWGLVEFVVAGVAGAYFYSD